MHTLDHSQCSMDPDDSFDDADLVRMETQNLSGNTNFSDSTKNMTFSQPADDVSPNDVTQLGTGCPGTPSKFTIKSAPLHCFDQNYGSRHTPSGGGGPSTPTPGDRNSNLMNFGGGGGGTDGEISRSGRFAQDFVVIDTIGSGSFGSVHKCQVGVVRLTLTCNFN